MMYLRTQFNVGSSNGSLIAVNKRVVKYGFQAVLFNSYLTFKMKYLKTVAGFNP